MIEVCHRVSTGNGTTLKRVDCFLIFLITLLLGWCPRARAEPIVEMSGATGFGALVAGVTSGRFAELLFSCLEKQQWSTPVEVFVSRGAAGEELRKWLGFTGDFFLAIRLAQWARHNGSDAALMSEPCQGRSEMNAARYRLSDEGHAIKDHGLAEIARGAPLPVWGATAYDPLAPWVVVDDDTGHQRIQQLGG